jgi:hypothetical protein
MAVTLKEISNLRAAIQTDKENKIKAEAHADKLSALQKRESELKLELEEVQKDIVAAINVTFDVSDEMSIASAEEVLAKLESQYEAENGETKK